MQLALLSKFLPQFCVAFFLKLKFLWNQEFEFCLGNSRFMYILCISAAFLQIRSNVVGVLKIAVTEKQSTHQEG